MYIYIYIYIHICIYIYIYQLCLTSCFQTLCWKRYTEYKQNPKINIYSYGNTLTPFNKT